MSQAEDLLNGLSETVIDHEHPVPDSDTYFIIDPYTRQIENTNYNKTVLMCGDHNSERFTFELPRYVDGHDMSLCNRVIVHFDNVGDSILEINSDVAYADDLRLNPNNPETVICSWLIRREATRIVGILSFSLQYLCVEEDEITYEWNTDSYDGIEIRKSKQNGEAAITKYTNVLEQWRAQIFGAGDSVMANITAEGETQVTAIKEESEAQQEAVELKGANTLDTIPEDYTETSNAAEEAVRSKSDAIVCEAEGDVITITDSSDDYIRGLKIYGKTTQVTTNGHQLFDQSRLKSFTAGGATITNNGDGSFTIEGTGALTDLCGTAKIYTHEETITILKKPGTIHFVNDATSVPYLYVAFWQGGDAVAEVTNRYNKTTSAVITENMFNDETFTMRIGFYGFAGDDIVTTTVKPMLYMDGDGTWEPFTGGMPAPNPDYPQEIVSVENIRNVIYGGNLADVEHMDVHANQSLTVSDNGYKIVATGGSDKPYTSSIVELDAGILKGKKVILRADRITNTNTSAHGVVQMNLSTPNGTFYMPISTYALTKEIDVPSDTTKIVLSVYTNNTEEALAEDNVNTVEGLGVYAADVPWTRYQPAQYIAAAHTLRSLTVTYWDNSANEGKLETIRDYIDFERGVLVQRIGLAALNDYTYVDYSLSGKTGRGQLIAAPFPAKDQIYYGTICNVAIRNDVALDAVDGEYYENPANVVFVGAVGDDEATMRAKYADFELLYVLAAPIETPLTAEEITAFRSLRTNYPNTTILNDAGAWMSVKYNADTKTYVENPKTLKLVDSSTGVVYELKIVDGNLTVTPV